MGMCWKKPHCISAPGPSPLSYQAWKSGPLSARKLPADVDSDRAAERHPFFHGQMKMAASRQVRRCIRLRAERKQIAEKCTSRQFGLNMRNGIRSVII